jgi:hypothetical protein
MEVSKKAWYEGDAWASLINRLRAEKFKEANSLRYAGAHVKKIGRFLSENHNFTGLSS